MGTLRNMKTKKWNISAVPWYILYAFVAVDELLTPETLRRKIGENGTFSCHSDIQPKWHYVDWEYEDSDLPSNAIIGNKQLLIKSITTENRGYYECEGTVHGKGTFFAKATLRVIGEHNFQM